MSKETNFTFLKFIDLFGRNVNLRFQGQDKFKTNCGGMATLFCIITLLVFLGVGLSDIHKGKLESFNYVVKNSDKETEEYIPLIPNEVLAFAIDSKFINSSHIEIRDGYYEAEVPLLEDERGIHQCSEFVYDRLSDKMRQIVPSDLHIFCLDIGYNELKSGVYPRVKFEVCQGKEKCAGESEMRKLLKQFDVWIFALVDSSDFTSNEGRFNSKFTGKRIQLSLDYNKKNTIVLREVQMAITRGIFVQKTIKRSTNMFLSNEQQIVSTRKGDPNLLDLMLEVDRNSHVQISKKYQSILNLLAFIGGLSKGVIMLMLICVFPVRELLYYKKLINHMFNVCLDETQVDIALDMMFSGVPDDDYDDDPDTRLKEQTHLQVPGKGKKKELLKSDTFKRKQKRLSRINKMEMIMRNNQKRTTQTGLMDQVIETNHKSSEFFANMLNALQGKKQDFKNFSDLLGAGLGKRNKRREKTKTQPPNILANGEFRDLTSFELMQLDSEFVGLKLKQWVLRVKKRVFTRKREKYRSQEIRLQNDIKVDRKKLMIKRLKTAGPKVGSIKKKIPFKSHEIMSSDSSFQQYEIKNVKRTRHSKNSFLSHALKINRNRKDDKNEGLLSEKYQSHLKDTRYIFQKKPSKNLKFKEDRQARLPSESGGGTGEDKTGHSNLKKKTISTNSLRQKPKNPSTHNPKDTHRDLLDVSMDDEARISEDLVSKNSSKTDTKLLNFVQGIKSVFGLSKNDTRDKQEEKEKHMYNQGVEKLETLKKKNLMMYKNEDKLKFYTSVMDYFRLWISPIWKTYSKRILFIQGREMIRNKLEVATLIKSLNELEKLKLLLFDQDQYYLFEHIPKPFLIDYHIIQEAEKGMQEEERCQEGQGRKKDMKGGGRSKILMSNNTFWNKGVGDANDQDKFNRDLDFIKKKGEDMNVIDKRLINIIERIY